MDMEKGKREIKKKKKKQVYLVSSSHDKGVWHSEQSVACIETRGKQIHPYSKKGMLGERGRTGE
jgi:hypothetical protein